MDRWELYTAGKIDKPTEGPQFSRAESHRDFVIDGVNHTLLRGGDFDPATNALLHASTATPVPVNDQADLAIVASERSKRRHRRERIWNETCDPGSLPMRGLQTTACGFALGVGITLLMLFVVARGH